MTDAVNKPSHYTSDPSGIECIEIAELLPFCLGNCYKYLHRAGLKGDKLTDLQKARYYAHRAYLNNEQMADRATNRIRAVAHYRDELMGRTLYIFSQFGTLTGGVSMFLDHLDKLIEQTQKVTTLD